MKKAAPHGAVFFVCLPAGVLVNPPWPPLQRGKPTGRGPTKRRLTRRGVTIREFARRGPIGC